MPSYYRRLTSAALIIIASYLLHFALTMEGLGQTAKQPAEAINEGVVVKVVDGRTIVVSGFGSVRLIGVETPETADPRKPAECMGPETSGFTKQIALGKKVQLKGDPLAGHDPHGRILAYVFLPDGRLLNEEILRRGYGKATSFNYQKRKTFLAAEKEAKSGGLGGWTECDWE
jgi:micrococcal nuclease